MAAVLRHDCEDVVDGEWGSVPPQRGGRGWGPLCVLTSGETKADGVTGYFRVFYLARWPKPLGLILGPDRLPTRPGRAPGLPRALS